MKSRRAFWLALVANVAPLSLCFLYRNGALLLFSLFPLIHILLFLLNHSAAKTMFQTVLLGLLHIAVTLCTHQLFGWLYLQYVFYDVEGKAIVTMGTLVGAIWTTILLVVSVILFCRKQHSTSVFKGVPKNSFSKE